MDWREFIASVIGHLAWPIVVVIAIFVLKEPLARLIGSTQKIKHKGTDIIFERQAEVVRDALKPVPSDIETRGEEGESPYSSATRMGRLLQAWAKVEKALAIKFEVVTKKNPPRQSFRLLAEAVKNDIITPQQLRALEALRTLRNIAAHSTEADISENQLVEFEQLASAVADQLQA